MYSVGIKVFYCAIIFFKLLICGIDIAGVVEKVKKLVLATTYNYRCLLQLGARID